MNNQGVFYAFSALLGILAGFQSFIWSIVSFGFLFLFLQKRKKFDSRSLWVIFILFLVFYVRSEIAEFQQHSRLTGNEENFLLFFHEAGTIDGDKLTLKAKDQTSGERLLVQYRIKSEKEKKYLQQHLSPGLVCRIKGTLNKPKSASNENAFNYRVYLERNHIYWLMEPEEIRLASCQQTSGILTKIKQIRMEGIRYVESHFPKETVPLAVALLFGTDDLIAENIMEQYRELGIVHLLAISGLHITIIVAIVYYLLLRLGVTREKSMLVLFICLPLYGVLAGASPSVIRSVLMTMLLLLSTGRRDHSRVSVLDVISFTFLLYVFTAPYAIYNIGFQLSFIAVLSLLLSAPIILANCRHPLSLMFSTSYISMICTAPVLLYSFFEFSIISLLVNLLYIPLFNLILLPYVLFGFVLHLLIGDIVTPLLELLNGIIVRMNEITAKVASLPWNTIALGRPEPPLLLLYGWGFFLLFVIWEASTKGKAKVRMLLLGVPCLLFSVQYILNHYPLEGEITFLDVGQGDCIFIRLPLGKGQYVIDTGGSIVFEKEQWQIRSDSYETGKDTVVPYLKSKGAVSIDKLILTHGDLDHAGGAQAVLQELKVKELVLPDVKEKNEVELRLIQLAKDRGVPVTFVHEGDSWKSGTYLFQVLSPKENGHIGGNDGSIVLYSELGGLTWLFTGDLEEEGEKKLLRDYPTLTADVLKVGHHGSKSSTSDAFIAQISPDTAVISVGENNLYQHPHPEVIEKLRRRNINILRTDQNGAITYSFRKEAGTFSVQHP
nr:DNA internalization-related competence protein ComEC/Rec2 [uncultured Bacillus sp.]